MVRKLILALSLGTLAFSTTACNTVRGVGDDLKSAANEVDRKT